MNVFEVNMDGLVGTTHNYAGLSFGNVASISNALLCSNPRLAAQEGLKKMRLLHSLGLKQAILPPHQRPNLQLLHQLGFKGTPTQQLNKAYKTAPQLLSACYSASSMWAANTATVSASVDTSDNKVHFTAANLISNLHRYQEAAFSHSLLRRIFSNTEYFTHHPVLPASISTADEGAANYNRLCKSHNHPAVHIFVYGKNAFKTPHPSAKPAIYPARQTREASEAIARNHLLGTEQVIFACQNPNAVDQGVFHNDVISIANESVFLLHSESFFNQKEVLDMLIKKASFPVTIIEISNEDLSIRDAVETYLFNSQLITLPDSNDMILIAPSECEYHLKAKSCIDRLLKENTNPIKHVYYMNLKQSMLNGGGPACLRLRVPLNTVEYAAMHQGILADSTLLDLLDLWIIKHYRTEIRSEDLMDPQLLIENLQALDELTQILGLGSLYPFQQECHV